MCAGRRRSKIAWQLEVGEDTARKMAGAGPQRPAAGRHGSACRRREVAGVRTAAPAWDEPDPLVSTELVSH
jgi:hypothetical protein